MAKDYITIGKASNPSKTVYRVPVIIVEDNPFFEKVKAYANKFGLITYRSTYNKQSEELIFNLAPSSSQRLRNAKPASTSGGTNILKAYHLAYSVGRYSSQFQKFIDKTRIPTSDCYLKGTYLHIPTKKENDRAAEDLKIERTSKQATDAVAKELANQLALQAGDLIPKLENSIITTINSDAFVSKLANKIMLKQAPQLITNLNRIREQNSASDKQLKEELSKEFASAVDKLIDYWNK